MTDNKIGDLKMRRSLCQLAIKTLDNLTDKELEFGQYSDEDRKSAMTEYKRQLAEIDAKITAVTGTPPAIVVGLKTAKLFGEAGLEKGEQHG